VRRREATGATPIRVGRVARSGDRGERLDPGLVRCDAGCRGGAYTRALPRAARDRDQREQRERSERTARRPERRRASRSAAGIRYEKGSTRSGKLGSTDTISIAAPP